MAVEVLDVSDGWNWTAIIVFLRIKAALLCLEATVDRFFLLACAWWCLSFFSPWTVLPRRPLLCCRVR